jgi:Mlc titration factor MtfA (ptsG expression regulator)
VPIIFALIIITAVGAIGARIWNKRTQHKQLLETPLSDYQKDMVAEQVPLIRRLPHEMHSKLQGKISLFLHQVNFVGCNGLEITEEMRLSIAAQASLLVVNSDAWYTNLRTILVYPSAFKSKTTSHDGFVVRETEIVRLGESWARGPVVLSWKHTKLGAADDSDGHNLVLHEFAHQLDDLSGQTNGVPLLAKGQSFAQWERVFVTAYESHIRNVTAGRQTVLNAYGAENHQEFFAVAIEVFFEKPARLKEEEPEVYAQLSELLRLDPSTWA